MNFKELLQFFITGILLGNGPCLAYCLPIILPIILAYKEGTENSTGKLKQSVWFTGLKQSFVFSISRLIAYSLLGFLSVTVFKFVSGLMTEHGIYLRWSLGIIIFIIGILYILGKELNPVCRILNRYIVEKSLRNLFFIGLIIGLSPCAPLAAVLTYIAAMSPNALFGLVSGFAFGLGTVISIAIPVGTLAGYISQRIRKLPIVFKTVQIVSGVVLIYIGFRLINLI